MNKRQIVFGIGAFIIAIYGALLSYMGWSGGSNIDVEWLGSISIMFGHFMFLFTIFLVTLLVGLALSKNK